MLKKKKKKISNGCTPLYLALQNSHDNIIRFLIEHWANVNEKKNDNRTPLYVASQNGHENIVRLLVEHGANVNEKNNIEYTILHRAAFKGTLIKRARLLSVFLSKEQTLK